MILEYDKQFALPELCRRLMDCGAPTGTGWAWLRDYHGGEPTEWNITYNTVGLGAVESYPAYSVAELGELLPRDYDAWITRVGDSPSSWFLSANGNYEIEDYYSTEAQARATLLIHLIETGQVSFEKANEEPA